MCGAVKAMRVLIPYPLLGLLASLLVLVVGLVHIGVATIEMISAGFTLGRRAPLRALGSIPGPAHPPVRAYPQISPSDERPK
jgi:hypothetical protein